ncbi:MAG: hypothetical protein NC324_03100 [Bacteroides sp.]|nr:hypothetical protein [Bacteroides sp.]
MPTSSLNYKSVEVHDGNDSIVIVKALGDIPGGRTLDVTGVAAGVEYVRAGHILVQNTTTKAVSPLGVKDGEYVALPAGHVYLGVLKASVLVKDPRGAILTMGQVNAAASPYPVTDAIRNGLPNIQFLY